MRVGSTCLGCYDLFTDLFFIFYIFFWHFCQSNPDMKTEAATVMICVTVMICDFKFEIRCHDKSTVNL